MKTPYRYILFVVLILGVLLACNTFSGIQGKVKEVQGTVGSVVTQAEGLATAVTTVKAFATEAAPLLETAVAYATENPGLEKTALALATEAGVGEQPADIPILPRDQTTAFFTTSELVSYSTSLSFNDVKDFYETEMPKNGWEESSDGQVDFDTMWVRSYLKPDRTATITLAKDASSNTVTVVVLITPR